LAVFINVELIAVSFHCLGINYTYTGAVDLRNEIAIPNTLSEIGVMEEHIDELSRMAAVDPTVGGNPLPLNETDMAQLYQAVIKGNLSL